MGEEHEYEEEQHDREDAVVHEHTGSHSASPVNDVSIAAVSVLPSASRSEAVIQGSSKKSQRNNKLPPGRVTCQKIVASTGGADSVGETCQISVAASKEDTTTASERTVESDHSARKSIKEPTSCQRQPLKHRQQQRQQRQQHNQQQEQEREPSGKPESQAGRALPQRQQQQPQQPKKQGATMHKGKGGNRGETVCVNQTAEFALAHEEAERTEEVAKGGRYNLFFTIFASLTLLLIVLFGGQTGQAAISWSTSGHAELSSAYGMMQGGSSPHAWPFRVASGSVTASDLQRPQQHREQEQQQQQQQQQVSTVVKLLEVEVARGQAVATQLRHTLQDRREDLKRRQMQKRWRRNHGPLPHVQEKQPAFYAMDRTHSFSQA